MNPGKLNRRITVQSRTLTRDATGGKVEAWTTLKQLWAEQLNQKQIESTLGGSERNVEDVHFRIRYYPSLASGTNRVTYNSRTFDIVGITEEGIRTSLILSCRSVGGLEL